MLRYWDGQPVQFVCCERANANADGSGDGGGGGEGERDGEREGQGQGEEKNPWGRVFWCVVIELADGEPGVEGDLERLVRPLDSESEKVLPVVES